MIQENIALGLLQNIYKIYEFFTGLLAKMNTKERITIFEIISGASLERHQIFVYEYAGGSPEHGLYNLVRGHLPGPGESGTHFSNVMCLTQYPRL